VNKEPEKYYKLEDPDEEDRDQGLVETKLLEIDELGSGDCFGDDSLILGFMMDHSVVSAIPTEIYVLDSIDFEKLGMSIRHEFEVNRKVYPTDEDIRRAMIEMKKWEKFKKDLVQNIKTEKEISKGFDYRMRQNFKKKAKVNAFDDISDDKY